MAKMKVFVGKDHKILYSNRGQKSPTLISYVYEYEAEEEDVEYWNSLEPGDQEAPVDEAEKGKTDLRSLIREKRRRADR